MKNERKIEDFDGLVAVVTGGSSGIGAAIAAELASHGAVVVIVGIDAVEVERVAAQLGVRGKVVDVRDPEAVERLADEVETEFGRVDIIVNNAGVGPLAPFADFTLEDFHWVMDINFWGVLHGIRSFLPRLQRNPQGGYIVNTASLAAFIPSPGTTAYAASKAAVVAVSERIALEVAEDPRIGVSILAPAPVNTAINDNARSRPGFHEGSPDSQDFLPPLPRLEPEDVGRLVVDALREGERYILTHPQTWPGVEAYHDGIRTAHERALAKADAVRPGAES